VKPERLFLGGGRVRPIWRFVMAVILIVLANLAVGIILGLAFGILGRQPQHILLWANTVLLLALLSIFKMLTGLLENRPLGSMGLAFCGRWKTELTLGTGLGAAMILVIAAMEWGLGLARFSRNPIGTQLLLEGGAYYCVLFMIAAAVEEITFRGYAFQRLVDAIGPGGAVAILSVAFSLVHLWNPSHSWLSTLNTILVGIAFAIAYLRTRSLWLPFSMHFAWNFVLGYLLGLPVSGIPFSKALLRADVLGSVQLTGGNYGPEGGWLATGVILVATIYLLFSRSIYISEGMRALVFSPAKSSQESLARGASALVASSEAAKISLSGVN
jgi:membrane protease YdiL (CAAX protease family)